MSLRVEEKSWTGEWGIYTRKLTGRSQGGKKGKNQEKFRNGNRGREKGFLGRGGKRSYVNTQIDR